MIKLNILNMKNFLQTVNECSGEINLMYPDGSKKNINKQYEMQDKLLQQYQENKKCLEITLDIQNTEDYISIVSYYAGDC